MDKNSINPDLMVRLAGLDYTVGNTVIKFEIYKHFLTLFDKTVNKNPYRFTVHLINSGDIKKIISDNLQDAKPQIWLGSNDLLLREIDGECYLNETKFPHLENEDGIFPNDDIAKRAIDFWIKTYSKALTQVPSN